MICFNGSVCYYEHEKICGIAGSDTLNKILKNGTAYIYSSALAEGDTLWLGTSYTLLKIPPANNYRQVIRDHSFKDSSGLVLKIFRNGDIVGSSYSISPKNQLPKLVVGVATFSTFFQCIGQYNFSSPINKESKYGTNPSHRFLLLKNGTLLFTNMNDVYSYSPGKPVTKKVFKNTIIFLGQDQNKDLWLGFSKGGAMRFAGGNMESAAQSYFNDKSVSTVILDHEKGTWFSTLESGIYFVPMCNYYSYTNDPHLPGNISGLDVVGNKLFVLNNENQIFQLNSANNFQRISGEEQSLSSRPGKFYSIGGKYFFTGSICGEIDSPGKKFSGVFTYKGTRLSGLAMIQQDDSSFLILSGSGLYKSLGLTGQCRIAELPSRGSCMLKTDDQVIHVGTKSGLYRYSDKQFYQEYPNDPLFRQVISCMEKDSQGRLFIGTKQSGVLILHNGKYMVMGTSQGLPSAICTAILPDSNETVWVGTNKGIALLRLNGDHEPQLITVLDVSHGLPSNEITRLARKDNKLYVGTKEGLCAIDVSVPFANSAPPPVYIGSVLLNRVLIPVVSGTTYPHSQNNFRFKIDCMSFKNMFSPVYSYRLKGYDSLFQQSSSGLLEFNNLLPGNFELEVFGLNNNNVPSKEPAIFKFSISKPYWQRWWFILSEILAGSVIIIGIIRMRVHTILKAEEEKTKLTTLIAESQMTALRAQMNPHFIFNSINSIQNYILKQDTQQAYDYLAKFSKLIRLVLNNSKENMLSLEQELTTLSLYVELEQLRFDSSFDFSIDQDKVTEPGNTLIPGMLLQPFIENSIWHGIMPLEGSRRGWIKITIRSEINKLFITIEDNGAGRAKSQELGKLTTRKSVGMALTQNRISLMNQPGNDVKFNLEVEDLYDEYKQPSGTKIKITLPLILHDEN